MLVIFDESKDPYFNLASEEYLLASDHFSQPVIRIWQNSPAVIVGKFQNTLAEINQDYILEKNLAVVRRITGGGAVYHDLGNINYTIAQPSTSKTIDFSQFTQPVIQLLKTYGLEAENKGRNDIELSGYKISGGAQTIKKNRILHHGTLLFDAELAAASKALRPKQTKLDAKGVQSIRARIGNIKDFMPNPITVERFLLDLQSFFLKQGESTSYQFSENDQIAIQQLLTQKYSTWEWNYGQSPDYNMEKTVKYPWGELSIYLLLKNQIIQKIKIYGDFFSIHEVQKEFDKLCNIPYVEQALLDKIKQTNILQALPYLKEEELIAQLLK